MTSGIPQADRTAAVSGAAGGLRRNSADHSPASRKTLRSSIEEALDSYFEELDGHPANDLYELFLSEVEAPLLEAVLRQTGNNQSKTASMLGLNRGTLRKKLKKYGLL